jgi:hypothetical protein
MAEVVLEVVVQHGCAYVGEGRHCLPVHAHLLFLVNALGNDLVDRALGPVENRDSQDGFLLIQAPKGVWHGSIRPD